METIRTGEETDSKSVEGNAFVGSNPTVSAFPHICFQVHRSGIVYIEYKDGHSGARWVVLQKMCERDIVIYEFTRLGTGSSCKQPIAYNWEFC